MSVPNACSVTIKPGLFYVIKRDNRTVVPFESEKISNALTKAYLEVEGKEALGSPRVYKIVQALTQDVIHALQETEAQQTGGLFHVETIQNEVERSLMRASFYEILRSYILYRENRRKIRAEQGHVPTASFNICYPDGTTLPLDVHGLLARIQKACQYVPEADPHHLLRETLRSVFDGISFHDLNRALILSARALVETEPNYSFVAAKCLLDTLHEEVFQAISPQPRAVQLSVAESTDSYPLFGNYLEKAIGVGLLSEEMRQFDWNTLQKALKPERDRQFSYLGMQTLYDRYFLHHEGSRLELPQFFFMRVAMGVSLKETSPTNSAIIFYELLSSFKYMCSTPSLFNAGTRRPQLSSCYLSTVPDDLSGIYNALRDNALLSKFAGGLGNDWTCVRAMNSLIKGTNGKSQGVVPFLKVANDTAIAVNQGGKRKGAVCAYLETWHLDIEEFLELRKNTGDDRRRTHEMNTAHWIPDLFMQRVYEGKEWTLFCPSEVPGLHDAYGSAFETLYCHYEAEAQAKRIKNFKKIPATTLWRKMLSMIFETGHPWITFKDPCNLRSPQQHVGVVHSSNLCTEITLNTCLEEIAVCNLGSINLTKHLTPTGLDLPEIEKTIKTAVRMLDNIIDLNYYPVPQTEHSNLQHRPVGLGLMGFQDALYALKIPYSSQEAIEFADECMEHISYYALLASTELAKERGAYASFPGSLWSKGILPIDSLQLLAEYRKSDHLQLNLTTRLDWNKVREAAKKGIRNSNILAIAPTATISNICGVTQSIEPTYQNLYVKSNLSGEFTVINPYLARDLKALGIWDPVMVNDLKYFNGSIQKIARIPEELKRLYATAFELDPFFLIEAAARRQKWIDQSQSLNLYLSTPSGKKLDDLYRMAWVKGLKTTYYCRTLGATDVEKSTITTRALNAVHSPPTANALCGLDDPDCEACQ